MIDFRYHVVSIIAVFLALALGLFVGSTSLQDAVVHSIKSNTDRVTRDNRALDAQVHTLQNQVSDAHDFDKALMPYAIGGKLSGQLVTIVSMPGTSDSVRKQVLADVAAAGGTVSAEVRLQNILADPKQEAFLTSLTDRVKITGRPDTASAGDARARAAAQLAAVLGVRPASRGVPPTTVETVLAAYSAAKLINVSSTTPTARPGTLALVLTGPAPAASADPAATQAMQDLALDLVRDLDAESGGAVIAGPSRQPGAGTDLVGAVASDSDTARQVSTVLGVDTAAGQIAAVYALAAQVDGVAGRYGPGASSVPLPTASAAP